MFHELAENPFEQAYFEQELRFIKEKLKPRKDENIEVCYRTIRGRYNGYMYVDWLASEVEVPVLLIDGEVWMSITPMEVESHYMPIELAVGDVGVAGLGLGYYVQRILEKEEVESVTVYEKSEKVISLYRQIYGENDKLTILNEDVREMNNQTFDFFYCDIYQYQGDTEAFYDMKLLTEKNDLGDYHFWTQEMMYLELVQENIEMVPFSWQVKYAMFLEELMKEKQGLVRLVGLADDIVEAMESNDDVAYSKH